MANKRKLDFRIESYGLFLDIDNGLGRIGVNQSTGEILLDEGEGRNRFHGAIIGPGLFEAFEIKENLSDNSCVVVLRFDNGKSHELGVGTKDSAALWINRASEVIENAKRNLKNEIQASLSRATSASESRLSKGSVVIIDDHSSMLQMLSFILPREGYDVVGQAAEGHSAMALIKALKPDLAVVDLVLPGLSGLEILTGLKNIRMPTKFVAYTGTSNSELLRGVFDTTTAGIIHKEDALTDFMTGLEETACGRRYFSSAAKTRLGNQSGATTRDIATLGIREQQVFKLLIRGVSNREISARIGRSIRTVEVYRRAILKKLGVKDLASLVRFCMVRGYSGGDIVPESVFRYARKNVARRSNAK